MAQDIAVFFKVNAFQLNAVYQGIAFKFHFRTRFVRAVILKGNRAFLHIAFRHGGLEEVMLLHMVRITSKALNTISQRRYQSRPRYRQFTSSTDELQRQFTISCVTFTLATHGKLMTVDITIQFHQNRDDTSEQLFAFTHLVFLLFL
nr:hypothetical protein [synthetic construct]